MSITTERQYQVYYNLLVNNRKTPVSPVICLGYALCCDVREGTDDDDDKKGNR